MCYQGIRVPSNTVFVDIVARLDAILKIKSNLPMYFIDCFPFSSLIN